MLEPIKEKITKKILKAFEPQFFEITNESSSHAVPKNSESHFKVVIVSKSFYDLNLVQRHQRVYKILEDEMSNDIHALAMHTFIPEEWAKKGPKVQSSPNCLGGES